MGLFSWLEKKVFLGEVVRDYGIVQQERSGMSTMTTSVMVCQRNHRRTLVFRQISKALLGGGVSYVKIDLTDASIGKLEEIVADVGTYRSASKSA